MPKVRISINGCDDDNCFDMDVSASQLILLERLADLSYVDGGGCCPTLDVEVKE